MYHVVKVDGIWRECICTDDKPSKYGTPKEFKRLKDAKEWVAKKSYAGMPFSYEIKKANN